MPKTYRKKSHLSYTIGVYPSIELIETHPDKITEIYYSDRGHKNSGLQKLIALAKSKRIRVQENTGLVDRLSLSQNAYCIAYFSKYTLDIDAQSPHLLLDQISDTGNLGQIIRTALGFGYTNIAIVRPAVDIFDPRTIRASMGACFQTRYQYFDSFAQYKTSFPDHTHYSFMTNGQTSLRDLKPTSLHTLIFGNESAGLSSDYRRTDSILIPFDNRAIDSLNLSSAVAIGLSSLYQPKK
jgi:RNA methyltransferase, TrmH family